MYNKAINENLTASMFLDVEKVIANLSKIIRFLETRSLPCDCIYSESLATCSDANLKLLQNLQMCFMLVITVHTLTSLGVRCAVI